MFFHGPLILYPTFDDVFSSYPQGEVSFLPQLIAAVPIIMSWAALPWTPWFDGESFPYACIEWKENGRQNYQCFGLHLSDEDYWDPSLGRGKRWGVAIQMGTLFGIISLLVGGTAYVFLLSSMCFSLTAMKLRIIQIAFLVASFFAFMVITALGVDECSSDDRRRLDDTEFGSGSFSGGSVSGDKCEREGVHLMEGGVMFFLAFIFYILAAGSVEFYRRSVSEDAGESTSKASSKVEGASSEEEKKLIGTNPDVEEVRDVDEEELGEADV